MDKSAFFVPRWLCSGYPQIPRRKQRQHPPPFLATHAIACLRMAKLSASIRSFFELLADGFQFATAFFGGHGVRHAEIFERLKNDA